MMKAGEFYDLCVSKGTDMFGDASCLTCGFRIGSHGEGEFERCASRYQEES